jgi:hypothetical protein
MTPEPFERILVAAKLGRRIDPIVRMLRDSPRVSRDEGMTFPAALARALHELDRDRRLPPDVARDLRRAIAATPKDARLEVAFQPESYLGRFESLPVPARDAIVQAVVDRDRWEVRGYEFGPWHPLLRMLWRLKHGVSRWSAGSKRSRPAQEIADVLAYGARKAPPFALAALRRWQLALRGRFSSRPTVPEVLGFAGLEPRDFAICYAQNIAQLDGYQGYWHEPRRHNTIGRVIGIDLLPTAEGCWFVESNNSPALSPERSALYERDPFVCNLLDFAVEQGYRHFMVMDNHSSGLYPSMACHYEEEARARKIQLTLVEPPTVPGRGRTRSYRVPPFEGEGTLTVRIRSYPIAIDRLFAMKRATYRALALYQRETGDSDLLLPPTGSDPILADVAPEDPFPNVVYKLPELDLGRGVYFLKADSADHARAILRDAMRVPRRRDLQERMLHAVTSKQGLWQAYVKSRLLEHRRLYKVRALVLLTPVGIRFLSAHRAVSVHSVPERLNAGVIEDPRPYLANFAGGGRYEVVPQDEEPAVVRAAMAAARGLAWAAEYGFAAVDLG